MANKSGFKKQVVKREIIIEKKENKKTFSVKNFFLFLYLTSASKCVMYFVINLIRATERTILWKSALYIWSRNSRYKTSYFVHRKF